MFSCAEGHYFRGIAIGIQVSVAYADEQTLQDYRFWVSLELERGSRAPAGPVAVTASSALLRPLRFHYNFRRPSRQGLRGLTYRRK